MCPVQTVTHVSGRSCYTASLYLPNFYPSCQRQSSAQPAIGLRTAVSGRSWSTDHWRRPLIAQTGAF